MKSLFLDKLRFLVPLTTDETTDLLPAEPLLQEPFAWIRTELGSASIGVPIGAFLPEPKLVESSSILCPTTSVAGWMETRFKGTPWWSPWRQLRPERTRQQSQSDHGIRRRLLEPARGIPVPVPYQRGQ